MSLSRALPALTETFPLAFFVFPFLSLSRSALTLSLYKTETNVERSFASSVVTLAMAPRRRAFTTTMCPAFPSYVLSLSFIMLASASKSLSLFGSNSSMAPPGFGAADGRGATPSASIALSRSDASCIFLCRAFSRASPSSPSNSALASSCSRTACFRWASSRSRASRSSIFFARPVFSLGSAFGAAGALTGASSSLCASWPSSSLHASGGSSDAPGPPGIFKSGTSHSSSSQSPMLRKGTRR
mmetsp:Transcript_3084/g.6977  ORF Transcript_3084/g.6977 Transcript_3084/m.6977 type:complete len:243 (-) Transcript_3084:40-768(-)